LAFTKRWVLNGHIVIITGRRVDQLQKAQAECPSLITIVGDASSEIVAKVLNNYYAGEQCWYPE
jgi:short-subunit dehydrogenase involved in D-alanine esterification of teichoic acids